METPREKRLAENEAFFREVNEHVREAAGRQGADAHVYDFFCECADTRCFERVSLTLAEYERIRTDGRRFVIAPWHTVPTVEVVVAHHRDHVVIEKVGAAGKTAAELDPRTNT